jgi:hypothetical protein
MITFRRPFSVDRYLNGEPQPLPLEVRFRAWAIRLDAWAERIDWKAVELKAEKACAPLLCGAAIYLICVFVNAWIQGHFNLGGAR